MRILFVSFILLSTTALLCQDSYTQAITELGLEFDYYPIEASETNINYIGSGISLKEAILKCAELPNEYNATDNEITEKDFVNLTEVKRTNLKSTKHVNYTYDYLTFMEYTFTDNCEAELFTQLLKCKSNYLTECISKGGIEYWLDQDKIYFIITGAYYMTFKYPEILKVIKK